MDIISNLKTRDSTRFSIRRIGCIASEDSPFAFFKLVKWDSVVTLAYRNDSAATRKINLNSQQIKQIIKLEKQIKHLGSTSYDEYSVTRNGQTISRGRDEEFAEILIDFFRDTQPANNMRQ